MNIGFDAKRYFNNRTGLGNYSRWLIDQLQKQGNTITLFHTKKVEHQIPTISPTGLYKNFPALWRSRGLLKDLKKQKIKIYHGLSNELPFGIHKTGIKSVVTIHDLIQKRYPENYTLIDRSIYNRKIRYAQKVADRIVCPSEQSKKDLIRFFNTDPEKIKVIPLAVSPIPEQISESRPVEEAYVLCVSSFNRRKNLIRLARAFQESNIQGIKLVLAGKAGETLPRLRRMAEKMDALELVVNPSSEKIHHLYKHAFFVAYASKFEGFGIPVLEAYQHGKALALSDAGSLQEVAGEAAEYFQPDDMESILIALENVAHSTKLREHLQEAGKERLKQFGSKTLIEQYTSMYKELL